MVVITARMNCRLSNPPIREQPPLFPVRRPGAEARDWHDMKARQGGALVRYAKCTLNQG
jgi:hypothetical protein